MIYPAKVWVKNEGIEDVILAEIIDGDNILYLSKYYDRVYTIDKIEFL